MTVEGRTWCGMTIYSEETRPSPPPLCTVRQVEAEQYRPQERYQSVAQSTGNGRQWNQPPPLPSHTEGTDRPVQQSDMHLNCRCMQSAASQALEERQWLKLCVVWAFFTCFGIPAEILSDLGRKFTSSLMQQLL